jgi:hypothetical protein
MQQALSYEWTLGMALSTETFYSSSNGDRWQVVHDDAMGDYLIRHEPNLSSGGKVSDVTVSEFLSRSGRSPQAEALRAVLARKGE